MISKAPDRERSPDTRKYILLLVLLCLAFHYRILFSGRHGILFGIDYVFQYYGFKDLIVSEIRSGHAPLWNPYMFAGMPLLAVPWSGALYPPDLIFLVFSIFTALKISVVAHTILMALGMFWFCRILKISERGSFLGAVSYAFCAHFFWQVGAGHISENIAAAWLPFIFIGYLKYVRGSGVRWLVIGAGALAMSILGGNYQYIYYGIVAFGVWLIAACVLEKGLKFKALGSRLLAAGILGLLALALSSAQALPAMELFGQSYRSEATTAMAGFASFQLHHYLGFFFPLYGMLLYESIPYFGIVPLGLAITGLFRSARSKDSIPLFLAGLTITVLMMGSSTPLFGFLYRFFPGYKYFRIHESAVPVLVTMLCPLAGMGFDSLFSSLRVQNHEQADAPNLEKNRKFAFFLFIFMSLLANTAWLLGWFSSYGKYFGYNHYRTLYFFPFGSDNRIFLPLLIPMAAMGIIYASSRRSGAGVRWPVLLISLTLFDLFMISPPFVDNPWPIRPEAEYWHQHQKVRDFLDNDPAPKSSYRIWVPAEVMSPIGSVHFRVSNVNGYCSLTPERFREYLFSALDVHDPEITHPYSKDLFVPKNPFPLNILNIKYRYEYLPDQNLLKFIIEDHFVPRAFWIGRWRLTADDESALKAVTDPGFDPWSEAVLEDSPPFEQVSNQEKPRPAQITRYEPRFIEIQVRAPRDGILVLSEVFYQGWKAYVDNVKTSVLKVNYLLRGVPVTAGTHTVRFHYTPVSFYTGCIISITALIISLILLSKKPRIITKT